MVRLRHGLAVADHRALARAEIVVESAGRDPSGVADHVHRDRVVAVLEAQLDCGTLSGRARFTALALPQTLALRVDWLRDYRGLTNSLHTVHYCRLCNELQLLAAASVRATAGDLVSHPRRWTTPQC